MDCKAQRDAYLTTNFNNYISFNPLVLIAVLTLLLLLNSMLQGNYETNEK
jgi:hypothetical protein